MKALSVSALRTCFCVLHGISHFAYKPTSDLHEVVVGFSEDRTIALTIKFSPTDEVANPIHDLLKNFIDVELVDRLGGRAGGSLRSSPWRSERPFPAFPARSCKNHGAFSQSQLRNEWPVQVVDSDSAPCSQPAAENRSEPEVELAREWERQM